MLIEVELPRALRRTDPTLLADVPATVARVARYEIYDVVRAAAAAYPDPNLRSLDLITSPPLALCSVGQAETGDGPTYLRGCVCRSTVPDMNLLDAGNGWSA